jgi:aryl-alcohol dehydrogenase-like predicted oxidoreductase
MPSPRTTLPAATERLTLGNTGLQVSPYCVGLVQHPEVICEAFDAGINFFFITADMHWPLYQKTREGLAKLFERGPHIREQVIVAACSYSTQREFCTMPFMEVTDELKGLGYLDILVAGGAKHGEFFERLPIYQGHLRHKFLNCRAIGASFHTRQTALTAINHSMVDVSFIRYNAEHPGAKYDLLPYLKEHPRSLIYNFTNTYGRPSDIQWQALHLDEDYWRPGFPDYYRFVLARPEIDGLLIAPRTPVHLHALLDALHEGPLSAEEEEHLLNITEMKNGTTRLKPTEA